MRLIRTILERLECSFARQEAKLDQLLQSFSSQSLPQQPHQPFKPQQVSTPEVGARQSSVEYPFMASAYSRPPLSDHGVSSVLPATPLFPEVDRFLEDVYQVDREMPGVYVYYFFNSGIIEKYLSIFLHSFRSDFLQK